LKYRPWQKPVIERGIKALLDGRVYAINSPTGSGKTFMSLSIAFRMKLLARAKRVIAVTRTRNQMLSYERDMRKFFPGRTYVALISKADACPYAQKGADTEDINCELCSRRANPDLARAQIMSHGIFKAIDMMRDMREVCPYYSLRKLMERVDLVILTYPYLFSPITRKAVEGILPGAVVIVDEAHNLDNVGELFERRLSPQKIDYAIRQAKRLLQGTYILRPLVAVLEKIKSRLVDILSTGDPERQRYLPKDKLWELAAPQEIATIFDAAKMIRNIMSNIRQFGVNWVGSIAKFFESIDDEHLEAFYTTEEVVLKLVDPEPFLRILGKLDYVILQSGTLPPKEYMEKVWGITKPIEYVDVDKEYGPVFPEENKKFIVAEDVNTRYNNRNGELWDKYACYLEAIYRSAEANVLAVAPSYKIVSELAKRLRHLPLIVEERKTRLDQVQEKIRGGGRHLILAVAQGKLSEGIEFTDPATGKSLLSDIVLVGIPYPMPDDYHKMRGQRIMARITSTTLTEFDITMHIPAVITVKQALGRAIRSREDKARFWLLDHRYLRRNWLEDLNILRYEKITLSRVRCTH